MGHGQIKALECLFSRHYRGLEVHRWKADGRGGGRGTPPGVRIIRSQQQQQQAQAMITAATETGNSRMGLSILSSIC